MLSSAILMAHQAHKNQVRKGSSTPYIVHPVEVAIILAQNGVSEEVIIAGLLHDTLEDTGISVQDIREMFDNSEEKAEKVLALVKSATEPEKLTKDSKKDAGTQYDKKTWKKRKKHTIEFLKGASKEAKLIACADKLSNSRSMLRDIEQYQRRGERESLLWDRFNAPYECQKWYYENIVKSLADISDDPVYREFKDNVSRLFGDEAG